MKKRLLTLATVIFAFVMITTGRADTVSTSDGSTLVGKIEQVAGGKLVILTEVAGRLEIDASMVIAIATDEAVHVEFSSGDKLVGIIETPPGQETSVVRSKLGDIPMAPSQISWMWPEGGEDPQIVALREQAQADIEAAKPMWLTTLEAGATRTEGNTDTLKGHGRLDVKRTTPEDLLHFYLAGRYDEQDDRRTTNEYLGGVRYENMLTELRYWYTRTELEFDEFEGIDLRATAAIGVGRFWLKEPDHELKTSIGVGYRHETYDSGRTEDDAVLDLGLDYRHDIAPWAQLTHGTVYSPDFLEFDNYRLRLDTALLFPFKDERLSWKVGMRNEYNSRPQSGFERLDNTYYTSIVLSLK